MAFIADDNRDRKSTRLNSSHVEISYAVFCLKKTNERHSRRELLEPTLLLNPISSTISTPSSDPDRLRARTLLRRFRFFFFNDTATTEIYTLSLHDALPIYSLGGPKQRAVLAHLLLHAN